MSANKRLLKVAKYLGNQGLYEEAAQIKKLAMETSSDKRDDKMRNSEIGKLLKQDSRLPQCNETNNSWGIGIGEKGSFKGTFVWYHPEKENEGKFEIQFFKPMVTKEGKKIIFFDGEKMKMDNTEIHAATKKWLKEGSDIIFEAIEED